MALQGNGMISEKIASRIDASGTGCGNIKLGSRLAQMQIVNNPVAEDGVSATEGTWRTAVSATGSLEFQRYESGSWVTKGGVDIS